MPTMTKQVDIAFDLLQLQPGQHLLELGCGDGKLLLAAARRGVRATGYELNPILVLVCLIRTWRYRSLVRVRFGNFWRVNWPPTDAIFSFIMPKFMAKLDHKIVSENRGPLKVVSFAFPVPGRAAQHSQDGVYLYNYK